MEIFMINKTDNRFKIVVLMLGFASFLTITGLGQSPSIVIPPASQVVPEGGNAYLSVSTSGALPITYTWTWFKNGSPPTQYYQATLNSTNCTLALTNLQLSDAGFFNLDTHNSYGYGPGKQAAIAVISSGMATNGFVLTTYGLTNSVWTINCTTNLNPPNWFTLTNFSIPSYPPVFKFVDLEATNLNRFYQVIPKVY
jgi:Immunoglobulin domain